MSNAEADQLAARIGSHTRETRWAQLQPALGRLGLQNPGPDVVAGWLQAATGGSAHEATHALHAMERQRWSLEAAEGGSFTLSAGGQAWRLQPVPPARPAAWRVEPLHA